jgi:hypothetical protein
VVLEASVRWVKTTHRSFGLLITNNTQKRPGKIKHQKKRLRWKVNHTNRCMHPLEHVKVLVCIAHKVDIL